jgi:hypothetical protein
MDWNLDFRSELYKQEFYRTDAWTSRNSRQQMLSHWDSNTTKELGTLVENRMPERAAHLGSIIREQQSTVLIGYWNELLPFGPATHPLTNELVHASLHLAGSVAMYFKDHFNRVRPWVLQPRLSPPIFPLPGHPAYPSGHSTQMHLMALTLGYLVPTATTKLTALAWEVAVNRERAGLHYPSDTEAGSLLADRVFTILTKECALFHETLQTARKEH